MGWEGLRSLQCGRERVWRGRGLSFALLGGFNASLALVEFSLSFGCHGALMVG